MSERPHELDTVKLRRDVGGWPSGTKGVVVSAYDDGALLEIVTEYLHTEDGLPLRSLEDDLVDVRYADVELVTRVRSRAT